MDVLKVNIDQLLEDMMALAMKEDDPQVVVDARNITSKSRSSPLCILEVANPEFGLLQGYTHPEGVYCSTTGQNPGSESGYT